MRKLFFILPLFILSACSPNRVVEKSDFSDVYFNSQTIIYDGNAHILDEVSGAPEGTVITYQGREEYTDVGTYEATALLTKDGYNDKELKATLSIENANFSNITFKNLNVVYDGNEHTIVCEGVPSFATVIYKNNTATDVGIYRATAIISAPNYADFALSATLTITKATFTDITFDGDAFEYDGQPHSIYVKGAPEFATVTYTNNGKTNVGTYNVTAKISSPNYNTLTKTAVLRIVGRTITGITFDDQTFTYDGNKHSIAVSGELPDGVSVSYTNNGKVDSGTYQVTAKLSGVGYEPLELKANLIIEPVEIDKPGYFSDVCIIYDGQNHTLEVENAPYYSTVTYRCLNANGTNTFKNPGQYDIEATVKMDDNWMSVLNATMFIVEKPTFGVDSTKTALNIDENLTWDELYEALSHDNFTYDYYSGSYKVDGPNDHTRPNDLLDETFSEHKSKIHFVTDGKQAYSRGYSTYSDPYYSNTCYQEVGDDIIYSYFHDDGESTDFEKFPKEAFSETVCKPEAANAFIALNRSDDGGFISGIDKDDYYKDDGYPFIQDGQFIVLMEHLRSTKDGYYYVYEIYKFYNIGNTTLTILDNNVPSIDYLENKCPIGDYRLGGVKYRWASYGSYNNITSYFSAEIYVSYRTKIFLKPGTYTVLPFIYDNPVRAIVHYSYYNEYYNYDQSGYTFNLYIDEEGDYQGEYAELGSISRLDIDETVYHDGIVNYYADWHD